MLKEAQGSYVAKFDSPFTAWLYDNSDRTIDQESGDVAAPTGWFARCGRNLLVEDERGFVGRLRYRTVEGADEAFNELESEYIDWAGDDDV